MKKFILTVVAVFAAAVMTFAQQQVVTKPVVNVEGWSNSSELTSKECYVIRQNLISSLQSTKRVIVVDLSNEDFVDDEAERRKSASAVGDTRQVDNVTTLQANYILTGNIKSVSTEKKEYDVKDYKTGATHKEIKYTTVITFAITLIDPATGATVGTHNYSPSSTDKDKTESRKNAVSNSSASMRWFIEECFPVKGEIVGIAATNKKGTKAESVYINAGTDDGIGVGQRVGVYVEIDIAGELSEKEVGGITVTEVLGKNRAQCKVNYGEEAILNATSQNKKLTFKTRATKR